MTEQALTLQEAAKALNLSYSTVFGKRHSIGFRLPGSRVWRVWPSSLIFLFVFTPGVRVDIHRFSSWVFTAAMI